MSRLLCLRASASLIMLITLALSGCTLFASPTETHPTPGTVFPSEPVQIGGIWQITLSRVTAYPPGYSRLPGTSDPTGGLPVDPGERAIVLEGSALGLSDRADEDTLAAGFILQNTSGQRYSANNLISVRDAAGGTHLLTLVYSVPPSMRHLRLVWIDAQSGAEGVWTIDL